MQVKKYEAQTLQEAIEAIKREMGPDAIILSTKTNRKGFGLLSKTSVEVTVAITEELADKRHQFERSLKEDTREAFRKLPAGKQAGLVNEYTERKEKFQSRMALGSSGAGKGGSKKSDSSGIDQELKEMLSSLDHDSDSTDSNFAQATGTYGRPANARSQGTLAAKGLLGALQAQLGQSQSGASQAKQPSHSGNRTTGIQSGSGEKVSVNRPDAHANIFVNNRGEAMVGESISNKGEPKPDAASKGPKRFIDIKDDDEMDAGSPGSERSLLSSVIPSALAEKGREFFKKMNSSAEHDQSGKQKQKQPSRFENTHSQVNQSGQQAVQSDAKSNVNSAHSTEFSPSLSGPSLFATPALQSAYDLCVLNGIDRMYAYEFIQKAAFELGPRDSVDRDAVLDIIASEILTTTPIYVPSPGQSAGTPRYVALVGPTGVGKTTTITKLSSMCAGMGLKVGLVCMDVERTGATEQLGTLAKMQKIPFRIGGSAIDLQECLRDFASLDIIFFDAPGVGGRDIEKLRELEALLHPLTNAHVQLVLPATMRESDLNEITKNYVRTLHPRSLIFSKLDDTTQYGCIYNIARRYHLGLAYFTSGQRIPDDIEEATAERVASLTLDID